MNLIEIRAPRWKDYTVLVAKWKVGQQNKIVIQAQRKDGQPYYPQPFIMSGEFLRSFPLVAHRHGFMYEVPLADLMGVKQLELQFEVEDGRD